MQPARKLSANHTSRRKMLAAINIQWKQLRPDLSNSPDELRDERLAYVTSILKLKRPLESLSDLRDSQLGKVLDHFRELQRSPPLPNTQVVPRPAEPAEIIHLATGEQVFTINKLLDSLGWHVEARKAFLRTRFKRENPVHLLPRQAHSLIRILLNIACQRELKERGVKKVTRAMIRLHIPALKARLGIDRKDSHSEETAECQATLISPDSDSGA